MMEIYKDKNAQLSSLLLILEIMAVPFAFVFLGDKLKAVINSTLLVFMLIGIIVLIYFLHSKFFPKRLKLYIKIYDEYMEVYDEEEVTTIPFAYIYNTGYIEETYYSRNDGAKEVKVGIDISWKGEDSSGAIELNKSRFVSIEDGEHDDMSLEDLMDVIRQHIYMTKGNAKE